MPRDESEKEDPTNKILEKTIIELRTQIETYDDILCMMTGKCYCIKE